MDFEKKIDPLMFAFLSVKWCTIVAFVIRPKTFFKTSFSSCRQKCIWPVSLQGFFSVLICWKLFEKPFTSWLVTHFQSVIFQNRNHSIDFLCKFIDCTLHEYDIGFKFFKKLFSEYFSLNSLAVLMLDWCFNDVMHIKMCIGCLIYHFTGIANTGIEDNAVINENIQK